MKPFMMRFRQGEGKYEREVHINMNQVIHITPNGVAGSVLTFAVTIGGEAGYFFVNETPDEIGQRSEWRM